MMDRYKKSQDCLARALKVTPGGAQTLSKRASRFPEGSYPVALSHGSGAYVWDLDGHQYLDMICGLACMTLGYDSPLVEDGPILQAMSPAAPIYKAVREQLKKGVSFSLATALEVEVAEKLCAMIPCAEQVRFVKTGSEATEAAIRVARKATGRDVILAVGDGYNSWHSWFQALKPEHPGIPKAYNDVVETFTYNNLTELNQWDQYSLVREQIAAIILEPCHYEQPAPGFLEGIREHATKAGSTLIFDEMVTGFRWANGGAQEYFGVTPDLACFGKAMANGFPLACLCGRADLMQHADVVSGTFGGEALSLAACKAVLDIYRDEPIIEILWARGQQFQQGFNDLAQVLGMPAVCDGFAAKPRIRFTINESQELIEDTLAMSLFLQETALRGVLWHPAGGNISAAMTAEDIDFALVKMGEALVVVQQALNTRDWSVLKGKPIQATPYVRKM